MRRASLVFLACASVQAASGIWVSSKVGPFAVYSDSGARVARERLAELEQFRFSLAELLGKHDFTIRPACELLVSSAFLNRGPITTRTGAAAFTNDGAALTPELRKGLARLMLEQNVGRLPDRLERGLETFLSTTEVSGAKVMWGAPPAPKEQDADWALVDWLVTNPDTYGKFRVLLANLQQGMDEGVAYRNSIGRSPEDVKREVEAYAKAGQFRTIVAPSRPLSPERDLMVKQVAPDEIELLQADMLEPASEARYQALLRSGQHTVEAEEGLALLAIRGNDVVQAGELLRKAMAGGSKNAAAMIAYARMETDPVKAADILRRAIGIDSASAEGHFLLGRQLADPRQKVQEWTIATKLAPRSEEYWVALAKVLVDQKQWADATKAWRGAEQAADTPAEREKMLQSRLAIEGQRLDFEADEHRKAELERQREITRLKNEARDEIRAAEAKVNQGRPDQSAEAVPWADLNGSSAHLEGALVRVECAGKQIRMVIRDAGGKLIKISANGIADADLSCKAQKERAVAVDYNAKRNARTGVAGEATSIHFPN